MLLGSGWQLRFFGRHCSGRRCCASWGRRLINERRVCFPRSFVPFSLHFVSFVAKFDASCQGQRVVHVRYSFSGSFNRHKIKKQEIFRGLSRRRTSGRQRLGYVYRQLLPHGLPDKFLGHSCEDAPVCRLQCHCVLSPLRPLLLAPSFSAASCINRPSGSQRCGRTLSDARLHLSFAGEDIVQGASPARQWARTC